MICKPSQRMRVDDNLVEGNHIIGAEGVGIDITRAYRKRIVNNTITAIQPPLPFPGNTLGAAQRWGTVQIPSGTDAVLDGGTDNRVNGLDRR